MTKSKLTFKQKLKKVLNLKHIGLAMILIGYSAMFRDYVTINNLPNYYFFTYGLISGMALWMFGMWYLTDKKYRKYYFK